MYCPTTRPIESSKKFAWQESRGKLPQLTVCDFVQVRKYRFKNQQNSSNHLTNHQIHSNLTLQPCKDLSAEKSLRWERCCSMKVGGRAWYRRGYQRTIGRTVKSWRVRSVPWPTPTSIAGLFGKWSCDFNPDSSKTLPHKQITSQSKTRSNQY